MTWDYSIVDVFTQTPLEGNALAVFHDAAGIDAATMQKIARETNLSETTFIFAPERPASAARVRIFTPSKEMVFAGHPTIGTAWVLRELGRVSREQSRFVLDENVGPVDIRVDGEGLVWLRTPPIRTLGEYDAEMSAAAIGLERADLLDGIPVQNRSAGNPMVFLAVRDVAAVDRAEVDSAALRRLLAREPEPTGVFVFTPTPAGAYSRMFASDLGIVEDPATGSATGPLAAFMMDHSLVQSAHGTRFYSEQGTKMGRRSILHVHIDGERGERAIEIGGHVTPVATATLRLPQ